MFSSSPHLHICFSIFFKMMLFYIFPFLEFTSIDLFTVMFVVSVLMFNFEIITGVVQDQLMMNAVFVLRYEKP